MPIPNATERARLIQEIEDSLNRTFAQIDWSQPAPEYIEFKIALDVPITRITINCTLNPSTP